MQGLTVHLSKGTLSVLNKQDGTLEVKTADPTRWQDAPRSPLLGLGGRGTAARRINMLGMDQSPLQLWIKEQTASPVEALLSPWVGQGWHAPPRTGSALGVSELVELSMT